MERIYFLIGAMILYLIYMNFFQKKESQEKDSIINDHSKNFSQLPTDIQNRIKIDFPNQDDFNEVSELIQLVQNDGNLGVGEIQLIRCLLIIAKKDKNKLREIIIVKDYYGDPRDVIMEAMGIPGNRNDHGITPFEN